MVTKYNDFNNKPRYNIDLKWEANKTKFDTALEDAFEKHDSQIKNLACEIVDLILKAELTIDEMHHLEFITRYLFKNTLHMVKTDGCVVDKCGQTFCLKEDEMPRDEESNEEDEMPRYVADIIMSAASPRPIGVPSDKEFNEEDETPRDEESGAKTVDVDDAMTGSAYAHHKTTESITKPIQSDVADIIMSVASPRPIGVPSDKEFNEEYEMPRDED